MLIILQGSLAVTVKSLKTCATEELLNYLSDFDLSDE